MIFFFRVAVIGMVVFGSVAKISIVWNMADLFIGIMAVINLVGITILSKYAFKALEDYMKQKKQGINPVFKASTVKGLESVELWGNEVKNSQATEIKG